MSQTAEGPTAGPPAGLIWRFLRFPLCLMGIEFMVVAGCGILAGNVTRLLGLGGNSPLACLAALVIALSVVMAYLGCRQWLEWAGGAGEFALARSGRELAAGLAFGFLLFSLMTGIVAAMGGFRIIGLRGMGQLWSLLAMAIVSGVLEETLFRAIAFRHLESLIGSRGALLATAAFFGAAHLTNHNATAFAALAIALEAGLMLGGAFMLTRRLWLAIGIHAGWNFTQGWVFSVPVSGSAPPLGLLITRRIGPDWLTGGDFGLEASVVAMIVALLAGLLILRLAVRRAGLIAPG